MIIQKSGGSNPTNSQIVLWVCILVIKLFNKEKMFEFVELHAAKSWGWFFAIILIFLKRKMLSILAKTYFIAFLGRQFVLDPFLIDLTNSSWIKMFILNITLLSITILISFLNYVNWHPYWNLLRWLLLPLNYVILSPCSHTIDKLYCIPRWAIRVLDGMDGYFAYLEILTFSCPVLGSRHCTRAYTEIVDPACRPSIPQQR